MSHERIKQFMLPVFTDERGSLAVSEFKDLPFMPVRSYFVFNTKALRGGHAHLKEQEVFVCIAGSFVARVHDGEKWQEILMNEPGKALYTDALIWHEFDQFSPDSVMLALSSTPYEGTSEYLLDFDAFMAHNKGKSRE